MEAYRAAVGPDNPLVDQSRNSLGIILMQRGEFDRAERTYLEILENTRRRFGERHQQVALVHENLGNVQFRAGHPEKTIEILREVAAIRREALGPTDPAVGRTLANLGAVLRRQGRRDGEGAGLWRSDGTDAGTSRIAAFISVRQLTVVGDTLFFVGEDAVAGVELWRTDGTSEGTRLVKDIDPTIWWGDYPASSYPRQLAALGNQLLFYAYAPDVGIELWRSDGTEAGTRLVRAIAPPGGTSLLPEDSDDLYGSGRPIFTVFRGRAYFVACDLEAGCEPWSTDGTYDGTRRLKDILPGPSSSAYSYNSRFIYPPYSGPRFGVSRDRLFFGAFSGGTGFELWTSDGTEAGTQRLKELVPGKGP